MDFVSIRVITDDVARLAGFYEKVTGVQATRYTEDFAELSTAHATLAIGSTRTVPLFAPGAARPADNHTVIIEFLVDDVDGVHQNLVEASSRTSSRSPPRCPRATGHCCSATPTATSSTSSLRSPQPPSRSSPADHTAAARSYPLVQTSSLSPRRARSPAARGETMRPGQFTRQHLAQGLVPRSGRRSRSRPE